MELTAWKFLLIVTTAFRPDLPAMHFTYTCNEREADADSHALKLRLAGFAFGNVNGGEERLEQERHMFRIDANACIRDDDVQKMLLALHSHGQFAAVGGGFDGVAD